VERALRGVIREALARASRDGLSGGHHFYLTFRTRAPGVELPDYLLAKYPDLITIVLEHQFWGLSVDENSFAVTLSFNNRIERVRVPFEAMTAFADPSVKFTLQFELPQPQAEEKPAQPAATVPALAYEKPERQGAPSAPGGAEVVTLDKFRKH
jgi:hypothetical protein